MIEIRHYLTASGADLFEDWLDSLRDARAEAKVVARTSRLAAGNFGDCKPLTGGIGELRIDYGPGYRVYYAMVGRTCVLLLGGGDKRRQSADIRRAVECWSDYLGRTTKS